MKVKTLIKFRDLNEKKIREVGEEFVVSKDRFEEILKIGKFVEPIENKIKKEEFKTKLKGPLKEEKSKKGKA